ncbi:MAG: hypothetical protein A4E49_00953 [Methanosaeta sp. PtaU1.Bin112]|nr:MAG: hypothetical protein A4E49_00953 [Methanosaeta sp. PtaU1.Bin112]
MFKYKKMSGITEIGAEGDTTSVNVDESESVVNCLIALYLLKQSENRVDGITKMQKITFAIQNEMSHEGICAISGEFFKWYHGPMSDEVYETNDVLVENGLVEDRGLTLTARGATVLDDFTYIIDNNRDVFDIIDRNVNELSYLALSEIKERIYSMMIKPLGCTMPIAVRDIPRGTTIFRNEGFSSLNIDSEDLETLEIYMCEEIHQSVLNGMDDAKSGRVTRLQTA